MISVGAKGEEKVLVSSENAISFLGLEEARVLATPQMILHMERTCRNLVHPMLEPGHDTVGTHVNVYHLAAAPMGSVVRFVSEITGSTDRRVNFRVEAWNDQEKVGEGTHERAIVNVAKFATRVAQKKV